MVSTLGLLFLGFVAGSSTTRELGPASDEPGSAVDGEAEAPPEVEAPPDTEAPTAVPEPVEPPPTAVPRHDALEHLDRAHEREAAGELEAAEAEVSIAISLEPGEAPPYLVRAQIRVALADRHVGDDPADRRARAALLRLAARDVEAYVEHAQLPSDGAEWYQTRKTALLREADALDPATPMVGPEPVPEVEPTAPVEPRPRPRRRTSLDVEPWQRTGALVGTGAVAAGAAVGLSAASLFIRQRCDVDGYCGVHWGARAPIVAPAAVLATLGTASIVAGLATAPALDRPGPRRAVIAGGFALGATAAVLGTITAALVGARWSAPVSPSDDAALGTTQALGNVSAASFTAALPLLGAGVTAWIRGRLARSSGRMARLRRARGQSPSARRSRRAV